MSFLDLLGNARERISETEDVGTQTETVRKIVRKLDELPRERARSIAAFAYLLGRVANADLDVSDDETRRMEEIVMEHGGLPEDQAIVVVQVAKTQNLLFGGTENYLVAREFEEIASREQKVGLVHCLFAVCASDEAISSAEEAEIRKIANELRIEHRDYIAIRSHYREKLDVFKKGAGEA